MHHAPSLSSAPTLRSGDRFLVALCLVTSAAAHVPLIGMHLSEATYIGVAFIVLAVAFPLMALLLVVRDTARMWEAVAVANALAVLAYLVTRIVALPQVADDVGNWTEPMSFPALASELLALGVALAVVVSSRAGGRVTKPLA
ncbi:hypothetical protein [Nocardioides panacisoli]|uniref:hypothetical protein n=1 Tax=Nocardioides panacisoli TaxID=627624 RepID=UPI0031CF4F73